LGVRARFVTLDDPLSLADVLILVPTRRAIRAVEDAFADTGEASGSILPRVRALGDALDETLEVNAGEWDFGGLDTVAEAAIAPPIAPFERRLRLTTLIIEHAKAIGLAGLRMEQDPGLAFALAEDLARLFDHAALERVDWSLLGQSIPPELAEHWQITRDFLTLLTHRWPEYLAEVGKSDPAQYLDHSLRALARAWEKAPPPFPIVIAGSTGSILATAMLMKAVAGLERGAVVLPGVDFDLDGETWDALFHKDRPQQDHPQYGLAKLLSDMSMTRKDVSPWTAAEGAPKRAQLLSQALLPASSSAQWQGWVERAKSEAGNFVQGLEYVEARHPAAEAGAIALILREAYETPGATAALVTPNRNLARRVAAEMERWGLTIDDSAGAPLSKTPMGACLSLVLKAIEDGFAPIALLSLLKHPLCSAGMPRANLRALATELEVLALRGPRPAPGLDGLRAALGTKPGRENLATLIDALEAAIEPLWAARGQTLSLDEWSAHHREAAMRLFADPSSDSDPWGDEAGSAAQDLFENFEIARGIGLEMTLGAYGLIFERAMDGVAIRPRFGTAPRLSIFGPLEARLQSADLVVLGGLNERVWPPAAQVDGWINRPMRAELGLNQPERRIGLSAHDFVQAACAPHVILTRSMKEEGAPATPSRWLTRLGAIIDALGVAERWRNHDYAAWGLELDRPERVWPSPPPSPCPPVTSRPRELPVTAIETWVRDPYALYVRRILRLRPLDPIDADPSAAERGTIVHAALERFVRAFPEALPGDCEAALVECGRQAFANNAVPPGTMAIWWPRFLRIAKWFAAEEKSRRANAALRILAEVKGRLELKDLDFVLTAKADRLELTRDGALTIIDYKTGQAPKDKQMDVGFSPQLPLEAAIALNGGFADVAAKILSALTVIQVTGKEPPGKVIDFKSPVEKMQKALAGLRRRIAKFDDPATPFPSQPHVQFRGRPSDFTYIARSAERFAEGDGGQ
jgi:ATP-dependent helicase/nuclease subunit B